MGEAPAAEPSDWLVGGGEAGGLVGSLDWSDTPLGPRHRWPLALRTVVRLVVESQFPMALLWGRLLWGRELILLYNDAYRFMSRRVGETTQATAFVLFVWGAVIPAPALAQAASAQETSGSQKTLELLFGPQAKVSVVSAREEPRAEAPGYVVVITNQEIRERGYLDLMDVLHDLPGFDYADYNNGNTPTNVVIRGLNANNSKFIVLRDGVPIDQPAASLKLGRNYPLYGIDRIEVLYGPASVVYGPDAVAAVVQLISSPPDKRPLVEAAASGGSFGPPDRLDRYQVDAHLALAKRFDFGDATASVRTYQSDGPNLFGLYPEFDQIRTKPPPFNGFQAPIRSWNASGSLSLRSGLTVGAYFTDHTWSSSLGNTAAIYDYVDEAIWHYRMFEAFAKHEAKRGHFDFLTIANYRDFKTAPDTVAVSRETVHYQFQQQETLQLDHRTTWTIGPRWNATGGLRLKTFSVVPYDLDVGPSPVETGGTNLADRGLGHVIFNRYGVFGLGEFKAAKAVRLTAGVSYDYDGNTRESAVLPRAGVVLHVSPSGTLKALYGEGFASANPDQQYQLLARPGDAGASLPNPNLRSERTRSGELRYEHRLGNVAVADVGAYYSRDNGIQQVVVGGPVTINGQRYLFSASFQNLGFVWSAGGDTNVRVSPASWMQVSGSYGLLYGKQTLPTSTGGAQEYDLAKIPRHRVLAGVTVRPLPRVVADLRVRWLSDVQTLPSNAMFHGGTMPGYSDLNLNLRVEKIAPGLDAHVLVQNLTDNRYYHFGANIESGAALPRKPQPAFRFLVGLTYQR